MYTVCVFVKARWTTDRVMILCPISEEYRFMKNVYGVMFCLIEINLHSLNITQNIPTMQLEVIVTS